MATMAPTPKILTRSFNATRFNSFFKNKIKPSVITVMNKRYQTRSPSLSVINLPNMAVNPAKKTATCNWISAFFINAKIHPPISLGGEEMEKIQVQIAD